MSDQRMLSDEQWQFTLACINRGNNNEIELQGALHDDRAARIELADQLAEIAGEMAAMIREILEMSGEPDLFAPREPVIDVSGYRLSGWENWMDEANAVVNRLAALGYPKDHTR